MKVYAVRRIDTDYLRPKYSSNAIYLRKSDATKKANILNRVYPQPVYEVVSSEIEWKVEE